MNTDSIGLVHCRTREKLIDNFVSLEEWRKKRNDNNSEQKNIIKRTILNKTGGAEIAGVDNAGVGNDGESCTGGHCRSGQWRRKTQQVDNDGVDFTELSWAAALPSCSRTERLKLTWKTHIFFIMPPEGRQSQPEHWAAWTRVAFHGLVGCQLTAINATAAYIMRDTRGPRTVFSEKMEYTVIRKGRGFVYACGDKLYRQVKKEGTVRYLKCCMEPCDGSAKLQNGEFKLGVRLTLKYSTGRRCCSCTVFLLGINRVTAKTQKPYLRRCLILLPTAMPRLL